MANSKIKTAKATYDFAKLTGAQAAYTLPLAVPTGAVVTRVFFVPITTLAPVTAKFAFALGGLTIKAATLVNDTTLTTNNLIYSTPAVATNAALTATISVADVTAGKYDLIVEYIA